MTYRIVVRFDVPAEHRDAFIVAALEDGRESLAGEPGTLGFDLVEDEEKVNRFYLLESYQDADAFQAHCDGPYFGKFFAVLESWSQAGPDWLVRGEQITA